MEDRVQKVVTAERLREVLEYKKETGQFIWRVKTGARVRIGAVAGCLQKGSGGGYRVIHIDGRSYKAARLAWLYMTGAWPTEEVDHDNRDRSDDRWANLLDRTSAQNKENTKRRATNQSGHRCISYFTRTGKWSVRIAKEGTNHWVGYFDTLEAAIDARDKARADLGLLPADDADESAPDAGMFATLQTRTQRNRCASCYRRVSGKMRHIKLSPVGDVLGLMCDECAVKKPNQLAPSKAEYFEEREDMMLAVQEAHAEAQRCAAELNDALPSERGRLQRAADEAETALQESAERILIYLVEGNRDVTVTLRR